MSSNKTEIEIKEMLDKQDEAEFQASQLQKQKDFFDLHMRVREHMGWTDEKTKDWFYSKNPHIGNFTPLDYYGKRPDKCIRWVDSMIDESLPL